MQVLVAHSSRLAACLPVAALLLCLSGLSAMAQDVRLPVGGSGARGDARGRIELSASSLPAFGTGDASSRSTRVDMIWLPPRHPNLGLALGLTTVDGSAFLPPGSTSTAPAVDLGLHWRHDSVYRVDVSAWMRMASAPDAATLLQDPQPNFGARLEMKMNSARHSLFADRGILGLQLDGGARIGVRRYAGHPMIYYRTSF